MRFLEQRNASAGPVCAHADRLWLRLRVRMIHMFFLGLFVMLVPAAVAGTGDKSATDSFAKCLTTKKATMYGSVLCGHCDDQKKMFGSSFEYVKYVECSVPFSREVTPACKAAGIRYTPTWIFADGERLEGVQTLDKLSKETGCPLQ